MTATIPAPYCIARAAWEENATLTSTMDGIVYSAAAWQLHTEYDGNWDHAITVETELITSAATFWIAKRWDGTYNTSGEGFSYEDLAPKHQAELLADIVAHVGEFEDEFCVPIDFRERPTPPQLR
ncbi:hypothetical protein ABZ470_26700 [Streptosporangium sp. NPDC020072]|uniref:hypothetical protein n=1 Tax=Streptosporangium sp. NPDC020072 TaxID=3154788 RepID=UPI003422F3FA